MTFAVFLGVLERINKLRREESGQPQSDAERTLEILDSRADD
jgi:hypothetical protein